MPKKVTPLRVRFQFKFPRSTPDSFTITRDPPPALKSTADSRNDRSPRITHTSKIPVESLARHFPEHPRQQGAQSPPKIAAAPSKPIGKETGAKVILAGA
ncbi:hypothetical protein KM043_002138 [Ampulex compressa]|nr:hypothetical protein KM043_002138 [Ampulex compressa]